MPTGSPTAAATPSGQTLRVLSLNIQVGLETTRYRHYITGAWRHLLPTRAAHANLERIAALAASHDLVALQEADAGSLRTARLNQVAHLARSAGMAYWHAAVTRDLGPFAQHCLGCLSRWPLELTRFHPLPGRLPGRGALEVQIRPPGREPLRLIIAHLALTRRARAGQLNYLASLVPTDTATLLVGDFNCESRELDDHAALHRAGMRAMHSQPTFPSWAPARTLDHMMASPELQVESARALDLRLSDHLPVSGIIQLRAD